MPTKKKRVGFIPRDDVMKIIDKLSIENNLSNSKIISILVEEALSVRGIFNKKIGKAGIKRHLGVRPTVRGVVMNPVDHPHGGGEGRTSGGRHPSTPWGMKTKGKKTRRIKFTSKMIISRRAKK